MPRYFFNLTDGSTIRDPNGDVGRNKEGTLIAGLHITVTNEQGEEVFRTPLAL